MTKQDAVRQEYRSKGYAESGDAYNAAMRKAAKEDNSQAPAPTPTDPALNAWFENCEAKCCGCCIDEDDPDNSSCCVIS